MGKEIVKSIKSIFEALLDIIYPPEERCISCGEEGFIGICTVCNSKIHRVLEQEEVFCYGYYGNILKSLILSFKYSKNFIAGRVLSEFLFKLVCEEKIIGDVICYVPMTTKAKRKRGFNQCEILASDLGQWLNIPVSNCIKKVNETTEQKTLTKEERIKNVKGIFNIFSVDDIKDKVVILIDDVITTGSTVRECMEILKKSEVKKIIVLTIAKSNI